MRSDYSYSYLNKPIGMNETKFLKLKLFDVLVSGFLLLQVYVWSGGERNGFSKGVRLQKLLLSGSVSLLPGSSAGIYFIVVHKSHFVSQLPGKQ